MNKQDIIAKVAKDTGLKKDLRRRIEKVPSCSPLKPEVELTIPAATPGPTAGRTSPISHKRLAKNGIPQERTRSGTKPSHEIAKANI